MGQPESSASPLADVDWLVDRWIYSEDAVTLGEIQMLNELLALDVREGFALDLPE